MARQFLRTLSTLRREQSGEDPGKRRTAQLCHSFSKLCLRVHPLSNCLRYCLNIQAMQANFPREISYRYLPFSQGSLCHCSKMASCLGPKHMKLGPN